MTKPLTEKQSQELADLLARDAETLTDNQAARLEELKARKEAYEAESLAEDNATCSDIGDAAESTGDGSVYVFANLPSGQRFKLRDGSTVTIKGMPVSRLKRADGTSFAGGKYGITKVAADKWAQVVKMYGSMRFFRSGLVFAAETLESGMAMVRERGGLRHGYEPIDPTSSRAKTTPKTEE